MTDASFFIPRAKLNAVHFMIPFNFKPGLWQKFKLSFGLLKSPIHFSLKNHWQKIGILISIMFTGAR